METALELIEIKDPLFPKTTSVTGSGEEYIVVSKADGKTYGILTSDFKAFLGTVQVTAPKALSPSDPAPTLAGVYEPIVNGTYANAGGLVRNTATGGVDEGLVVQFIFDGVSTWVKNTYPLPKSANDQRLDSLIHPLQENILVLKVPNGYFNRVDGSFTPSANWRSSEKIEVGPNDLLRRVGSAFGGGGAVSPIVFFDVNDVYLGGIDVMPEDITIKIKDYFPTTSYVHLTSNFLATPVFEAYKATVLESQSVDGLLDVIATLDSVLVEVDGFENPDIGYINASGDFVSTANWVSTPPVPVSGGLILEYTGIISGLAMAMYGYDANMQPLRVLLSGAGTRIDYQYTVPEDVKYIIASSRALEGDVYHLITREARGGFVEPTISSFMPKKAWSKQGTEFRMNPWGIIAKHPLDRYTDVVWDAQVSNELHLSYLPSTETNKVVELRSRDIYGNLVLIGSTTIEITHTVSSPSTSLNVIHLGDSTVQGQSSAGIEGAIINEVSRLLTGVGTALMTGAESPAPLALTNLYFRGTLGDQPILHEGRGGWATTHYLNNASVGSVTNAFWNPTTLEFDLGYYLTQNNFNAAQTTGGVDASGSNLLVIIQLGWNDVYNRSVADAVGLMKQLIDKIHIQKPNAKVALSGLQPPAYPNRKTFTGTRNVSVESIMRAIVDFSEGWQSLSIDPLYSSFVEFIPIAPFFFPLKSYPTTTIPTSHRDGTLVEVYTDHVHPNARGYAQWADVYFNYILFNYCKAT